MRKRSKILIVDTNPMIYDGIFSAIINYAENIDKSDVEIDFVSINEPETSIKRRIENNGFHLFILSNRNRKPLMYILSLSKLIRKNKYTLVHVHGSSCIMAVELLASKMAGTPCCPHSHNTNCQHKTAHRILKPLFNLLYKNGFACGEAAGKWLYGEKKYDVIRNGIVCERFKYSQENRKQIRDELGILEDTKVLISVAHFSEVKNHVFMLNMMKEIIKKEPSCCLLCVGIGELIEQVKNLILEYKLERNVNIMGIRQDVPNLLSAADVLILPSLFEGFPFSLVEAQASGIDCLVSSTVTKECCFSDNMSYLPLELTKWIDAIENLRLNQNRDLICKKNIESIRNAGYDITKTASHLKYLYMKYEKSENDVR